MKKNTFNLNNKNIIITGGNGFLGRQITEALLNEKDNVYIITEMLHDASNDLQCPTKTSAANARTFVRPSVCAPYHCLRVS